MTQLNDDYCKAPCNKDYNTYYGIATDPFSCDCPWNIVILF